MSSSSQRNLPRRTASRTTAPVSRAAKSTGPASCQRTTRGFSTSMPPSRAPSTQRARPRRTTSTSGSSGMSRADQAVGRPGRAGAVLPPRQGLEGRGRRALLGLLLALAAALAQDDALDEHRGVEGLGVVRALFDDHVLRDAEAQLRGLFLQARLPVQARAQLVGLGQQRVDQPADEGGGDLDPVLDVDRADERLDARRRGSRTCPGRRWSPRRGPAGCGRRRRGSRATWASARPLTTAARSLASLPSGSSGWRW